MRAADCLAAGGFRAEKTRKERENASKFAQKTPKKSRFEAKNTRFDAVEKLDLRLQSAYSFPPRKERWQRSSAVEQGNHNPLVGGSNPSAATKFL